jgi:hypothetical protein
VEWGTVGCKRDYWTAIGMNDRLFYCYAKSENIKHFE